MPASTVLVDSARRYLLDGTINLLADTIKVALFSSAHNPRPSAATWAPGTTYAAGMIVISLGRYYEALNTGVSSGVLPLLPTVTGQTTTDNTVTWYCWGYTPPPTHTVLADVAADEISGAGYTAGGVALTGKSIALDNHRAAFVASPATWSGALFAARYAYLYKAGTANSITDPLVAFILLDDMYVDVGPPVSAVFSLVWSPPGILTF